MTRLSRRTFGLGALCAIGASLAGTVAIADDDSDPDREALDPVEVDRREVEIDPNDVDGEVDPNDVDGEVDPDDADGEELAALIRDSHDSRCLCSVCSGGAL